MKKVKLVLISGYKRSGKDFVSEKLSELIKGSSVVTLAEPLKDIIATTMSVSKDALEKYKNNSELLFVHETPCTNLWQSKKVTDFRHILQRFGTDAMKKHFGDDVWVDLLIRKLPAEGVVIVSDWRFISEYLALSKVGDIITVRVEDSNIKPDAHISEHELDNFDFDYYIENSAKDESVIPLIEALAMNVHISSQN